MVFRGKEQGLGALVGSEALEQLRAARDEGLEEARRVDRPALLLRLGGLARGALVGRGEVGPGVVPLDGLCDPDEPAPRVDGVAVGQGQDSSSTSPALVLREGEVLLDRREDLFVGPVDVP